MTSVRGKSPARREGGTTVLVQSNVVVGLGAVVHTVPVNVDGDSESDEEAYRDQIDY